MSEPSYAGLARATAFRLPWWLRMLSRLPLPVLYALAATTVWVMRRIVRHRVETVRTNIERSFPALAPRERRRIESGYYTNLSQVLAEVLKMATLTRGDLEQRVRFIHPQVLTESIAAGRSVLVLCSHQCNWEWLLLALSVQL